MQVNDQSRNRKVDGYIEVGKGAAIIRTPSSLKQQYVGASVMM